MAPDLSLTAVDLQVENVFLSYQDRSVLENVNLHVPGGQTLALLGPSGCGKTSLLRTIAGLEKPTSGKISIGDQTLWGDGVNVRPEHRQVGMVFQDLALFPHLSVGANVAYGLSNKNSSNDERVRVVSQTLEMVNLGGYENRRISTLSGGQRQRVALARALAFQPKVLLLDEPFSSLDEPTRVELRGQVHELLTELKTTAIYVTHDQEESFILGDQVAVMDANGNIDQQDSPANLYTRPANRWVANFVGSANLIGGVVHEGHAETLLGEIPLAGSKQLDGTQLDVLIRPENLVLTEGRQAKIELIEYYGHDTLYLLKASQVSDGAQLSVGEIWVRAAGAAPLYERGAEVGIRYIGPPAVSFVAG